MRFRYYGVEFGGQFGDIIVRDFNPSAAELRTQDVPRPNADGIIAGREFFGGRTWAFDLVTNKRNLSDALAVAASLESQWVHLGRRLAPNKKYPLSYELDGEWRRVYGRPDKFLGPKGDIRARQGAGDITADFRVLDPLYYSDDETSITLSIIPASVGGLESPLVAPLTSVQSGAPRAGFVTNAGDSPTPLKVTFNGPIVDPWVEAAAGWEIGLIGSLAYDVSVTIDALEGTVMRNDGTPVGGMLSNATLLGAALLPTGQSELTFGGIDPTGTATVDLSWRNAYTSMGGSI